MIGFRQDDGSIVHDAHNNFLPSGSGWGNPTVFKDPVEALYHRCKRELPWDSELRFKSLEEFGREYHSGGAIKYHEQLMIAKYQREQFEKSLRRMR